MFHNFLYDELPLQRAAEIDRRVRDQEERAHNLGLYYATPKAPRTAFPFSQLFVLASTLVISLGTVFHGHK